MAGRAGRIDGQEPDAAAAAGVAEQCLGELGERVEEDDVFPVEGREQPGHCALPILRLVPDGATERRVPEPTAVANERCRPTTIKP